MTRKIAIFGAGGFAREVLQIILDLNEGDVAQPPWSPVGFIIDPDFQNGTKSLHGIPILESGKWLIDHPNVDVIVAIGSPVHRLRVVEEIKRTLPNSFATLVHPRAWVGKGVEIGSGSIICAGALITTDIKVGEHVHVNIGCTIGHDTILEDFVTLSPGVSVSGNVQIGCGVEVGTRAAFIPSANVGQWSVIGAGTIVTKSLPPNVTAIGVPAKVIKHRHSGWHANANVI